MAYDFTNPKRFFAEPLMRYYFTSMVIMFLQFMPVLGYTIYLDDGGAWTHETIFEPYVVVTLGILFFMLIGYTILYYGRGWHNESKWKIDYFSEDGSK